MANVLTTYLFVFVLGTFLGLECIKRVSPLLHTPLMSLTNAISAISVVGSIVLAGEGGQPKFAAVLGTIALTASMTNIVGGFWITDRMLRMFKKREPAAKPAAGAAASGNGAPR
jgi:NAD(P) transhydrogenase subunit alpha